MNTPAAHIPHRNYSLTEVREIYGGEWGRLATAARPRRPVPTCWAELEADNRHGAFALAGIVSTLLPSPVPMYLIGSRANGYWTEDSDWDLVLIAARDAGLAHAARQEARQMGYVLDIKFIGHPPTHGLRIPFD